LTVSAANEGRWGETIEVRTRSTSRFSVLLAQDVPAGVTDHVFVVDNEDVRVGSLLYLVQEVTATLAGAQSNGDLTFQLPLTAGAAAFTGSIATGMRAFTPDFSLITVTDQAGAVAVAAGTPGTTISLASVTKADGTSLKSGDAVQFAQEEALVVVESVQPAIVGSETVMRVGFSPVALPALTAASSRAYARDFALEVRVGTEVVEVHEGLSMVNADLSDHVSRRLGPQSNGSFLVVLADTGAGGDDVLMATTAFAQLTGGNDGLPVNDTDFLGSDLVKNGLRAFDLVDNASILCVPNASQPVTMGAIGYCDNRKDLFYIIDPPSGSDVSAVTAYRGPLSSQYAAIYYPWIGVDEASSGSRIHVPPSGAIAGTYAFTDGKRGVHKAPAGIDTGLLGMALSTEMILTQADNDILYQEEVNAIRSLPEGISVWGARTISADSEWKYVNVRRLFMFLEKSIELGTQWVVFEPNDATLWKSIERNIRAFLRIQWSEGKLVGDTEDQAFYVKCNEETNPPEVVNAGQVVTEIGVAPSKPAEFVVFRIQQYAGQQES
jgi:phage tail sheath protein FI